MLTGLLVLMGAAGPIHNPLPPMRFRVEYSRVQEFDLSSMGAPNQVSNLKLVGFVTLQLSDTAGGQLADLKLDSVSVQTDGPVFAAQFGQGTIDSSKGGTLHAYIVNGRSKGTPKSSVEGNTVMTVLTSTMGLLFPGAKPELKVGDVWADTISVDTNVTQAGQSAHRKRTDKAHWTATSKDGAVFKLDGTLSSTGSVETSEGQNVQITSTATRKADWPGTGPTTQVSSKESNNLVVTVPQVPTPILGTDVVTVTISILP